VQDHLGWFDVVEARGLTVDDMVRLLFARGVKHKDGRPFSVGSLSSALWRKRQETERRVFGSQRNSDQHAAKRQDRVEDPPTPQSRSRPKQRGPRPVTASPEPLSAPTKKALRPERFEHQQGDTKVAQLNKASISKADFSSNDRDSLVDARTSMKRAAAIRRKAD
jgi:antitoxin component of RelBE/YafQ-DinJ toxin-antitoxin module